MIALAGALAAGFALPAQAQVEWDVAIPWGPTEFHTKNAIAFAERVEAETDGFVKMTVHPGGSLGIRANESLRAVEDGSVQMAEFALFQNVGDLPILGIESIPFLIEDYDQLRVMHDLVRPRWEAEMAERNQLPLYMVPWPSQNFYFKKKIETAADFEGIKMRTYDANTATMVDRLGMTPIQLGSPDIVPALATGKAEGVMTSGTTAVAQKYWEFLDHTYTTNHLWASNAVTVNLDEWNDLPAEHQETILAIAKEMEPGFWEISEGEHGKRMQDLMDNGMTVQAPSPELLGAIQAATADMADAFAEKVEGSGEIIDAFKAKIGGS
ncbi:MAG: TRAP transporter substrate-binding protein [Pseudomonadota bacterium]